MYEVVILISNKNQADWERINGLIIPQPDVAPECIGIDLQGRASPMNGYDISRPFYLINEHLNSDTINAKVRAILNGCTKKTVLIAIHNAATSKLTSFRNTNAHLYPFSHEDSYPLWSDYLKPYIEAVVNVNSNRSENIMEEFNKLRSYRTIDLANSLRAAILTPLIPFHFYLQIENPGLEWGSILKESFASLKKNIKDDKLEKFLALQTDKSLTEGAKQSCKKVQSFIDKGLEQCQKEKGFKKAIEDLADSLEKAVSFIEEGEAAK